MKQAVVFLDILCVTNVIKYSVNSIKLYKSISLTHTKRAE